MNDYHHPTFSKTRLAAALRACTPFLAPISATISDPKPPPPKIKSWRRKSPPSKAEKKILNALRSRIRAALRNCFRTPGDATVKLVGCTVVEFMAHMENRFSEGMGWHNFGLWHIDHIRPCASFDLRLEKERLKCFHFSNLQPLWAKENMSKGSKWDGLTCGQ